MRLKFGFRPSVEQVGGERRWKLWRFSRWLALGLAIVLSLSYGTAAIAQSQPGSPPVPTAPPVPAAPVIEIPNPEAPATEIRGVWLTNIDSDVLLSRQNLQEALRRLVRLNFNTIYPTVWNGGYTLYPSTVAEAVTGRAIDPLPGLQNRDMLAEAVAMGHSRGLTVIPWFEFGLMAPERSELATQHPDWLTRRQDGTEVFIMHGDKRLVWLNPAHPEVQQFLVDLVVEVVDRYDIDGIQFDDHFGMPVELGYDPYTVQLYQQQHQGRRPPDNHQDPEWMRWRATQLTNLMVRLYAAVKTRKPNCLISLSPNPQAFAYQRFLQDWMTWNRLGFLDELIVQLYRTDVSHFMRELGELERPDVKAVRQRVPMAIGILTGLRILDIDMRHIENQVRLSRHRQFAGVAFFFYESLGNRDASFQALFPRPASRPDIRRRASALSTG